MSCGGNGADEFSYSPLPTAIPLISPLIANAFAKPDDNLNELYRFAIFHNHFKELQLWQYQATVVMQRKRSCSPLIFAVLSFKGTMSEGYRLIAKQTSLIVLVSVILLLPEGTQMNLSGHKGPRLNM